MPTKKRAHKETMPSVIDTPTDDKQNKKLNTGDQKSPLAGTTGTAAAAAIDLKDDAYVLPENWKWVLEILDAAHLPSLGLPVQWKTTQAKHEKVVFDPETKKVIDVKTEKTSQPKKSPVGFIMSTLGHNVMVGTETPAAVRFERFHEPKLHTNIIKNAQGDLLVPCLVHGDYVKVESLQADHMHAKENIINRQKDLVKKLNDDQEFAKFIMKQDGMEKFFVNVKDQYYGTLFFYELYFNDIDNIWLVCQACNLHKSNKETLDWLKNQWLYGEEFMDYLTRKGIKDDGILKKTQDKKGLAEVAIDWFWDRHANYISVTKELLKNVEIPIQILNMKLDRVIGMFSQKRTERLQASIDFRLALLSSFATYEGFDMPRTNSESPQRSSSDDDFYLKDEKGKKLSPPPTKEEYSEVAQQFTKDAPKLIRDTLLVKIREKTLNRPKAIDSKLESTSSASAAGAASDASKANSEQQSIVVKAAVDEQSGDVSIPARSQTKK